MSENDLHTNNNLHANSAKNKDNTQYFSMDISEAAKGGLLYEREVLTALLITESTDYIQTAVSILEPRDFYYTLNRMIFEYIKYNAGEVLNGVQRIDVMKLLNYLESYTAMTQTDKKMYIMKMVDDIMPFNDFEHICSTVKAYSTRRKVFAIFSEFDFRGTSGGDITDELKNIFLALNDLINQRQIRRARHMQDIMADIYQRIFGEVEDNAIHTGISALDKYLDGLRPQDIFTIAALTSVGKTAFMLQIAANIAAKGKKILIYSQEMSDVQNGDRILSRDSQVDLYNLQKKGRATESEIKDIEESFDRVYKYDIDIIDRGGVKISDIRLDFAIYNPDIIFVDHIGLMDSGVNINSANLGSTENMSKLWKDMKNTASDLKIPIVVLCQFNREAAAAVKAADEPSMSQIKNSSDAEQSSNSILIMWRRPDYETSHNIEFKLEKNRQGKTGRFCMNFDSAKMTFKEMINYEPYEKVEKSINTRKYGKKV